MWSVTWPFVENPAQLEYCPIFLRACVRLSYTCHFNFSQYFGGLNHVNHTFSECTSSRLTIFASLTTWTKSTSHPRSLKIARLPYAQLPCLVNQCPSSLQSPIDLVKTVQYILIIPENPLLGSIKQGPLLRIIPIIHCLF